MRSRLVLLLALLAAVVLIVLTIVVGGRGPDSGTHDSGTHDSTTPASTTPASGTPDATTERPSPRPDGEALHVLTGHTEVVSALTALPDGRLVSGSWDGTIRIWDLDDPAAPIVIQEPEAIYSLATLDDGRFVSGRADGMLTVWDPDQVENRVDYTFDDQLEMTTYGVDVITPLAAERVLVIVDSVHGHIVDLTTGEVEQLSQGFDYAMSLAVLPDNSVAMGSTLNEVLYWDAARAEDWFDEDRYEPDLLQDVMSGNNDWGDVALTALPDGRLVHGSAFGLVRVIDPADPANPLDLGTGTIASLYDDEPPTYTVGHDGAIYVLATMDDGRVVSGGSDRAVKVWDPGLPRQPAVLLGHGDGVVSLTVLSDDLIASGSFDDTIRIWQLSPARSDL